MLKTGSEIARLKGVSKQAVNNYILKNAIPPAGKKGKYPTYDCSAEPIASYLAKNKPPPEPSDDLSSSLYSEQIETPEITAPPSPQSAAVRIPKPLNDLLSGRIPSGRKPSSEFYMKALVIAEKNQDAALLFKLGQIAAKEDADETVRLQMIKTELAKEQIHQERANKLKIENEIQTGFYLEKSVVKILFGRVYAVHTSVLTPLPLKLSDMIDALPPSPDRRARIHKMIDNEIYAALETIQRLLIDYVKTEDDPVDNKAD